MRSLAFIQLVTLFLFSCSDNALSDAKERRTNAGADTAIKDGKIPDSSANDNLKISAHLIYDDGSFSSFDILNNKAVALWNVIGGEGDAEKPSHSSVIHFAGNLDGLTIRIRNGRKPVLDTLVLKSSKAFDYTVYDTGCEEVFVQVNKKQLSIYNDTIPFHCGE